MNGPNIEGLPFPRRPSQVEPGTQEGGGAGGGAPSEQAGSARRGTAASPAAEYRRLHEQVRVKQAAMESGREAYDVLMRKLKALKEMVDAAIGEV